MSRVTGNESSFATAVLTGLGAPVTQSNLDFILRWITREGGGGANNPLNTTQQMNGSTVLTGNTAGVQNYSNLDVGVQATIRTLQNGYYPNIVAALKAGTAEQADAAGQLSHDLSTWSGGSYTTLVGVSARPSNSIGGGGQSSGTGLGAAGSGAPLSGQALIDYADKNFPQYAYLLHDPEVGPILVKAAQENVSDPNILAGMLRNTKWWQTTSSTARDFNELKANDPATYEQAVQNTITTINNEAANKGVGIPQDKVREMAINYRSLGWTQTQLDQAIASYAKYSGDNTVYKGEAGTDVQSLKQLYGSYALKVSDQQMNQNLQDILAGKVTVDNLKQTAAQQAETAYSTNPQLVDFLKNGRGTVYDWASQPIQRAASVLGIDPNSIDLTAPMWSQVLKPAVDPATGKSLNRAMSLDEWETKLRTDPQYGFDSSTNGIQQASQLGNALARITGVGAF